MKLNRTMVLFLLCFSGNLNGQTGLINANNNKLQLSNLKEGKSTYLVYFTDSLNTIKTTGDIWERNTKISKFNNQEVIEFNWKWYANDSLRSIITNICDKNTLAPIYHKAIHKEKWIFAYTFSKTHMIPIDSVANNLATKSGNKKLDIPILSWEQDLETFQLLPINKIGQKFSIAFFDPNEAIATYHDYEVIEKEYLKINNDSKVLCWLLKINYDKDSYGIFWLSEKSLEVLKSKEHFNGGYRYKVKLY